MNEMKYWQHAMTDDEGNRVQNPNYILHPAEINPRRWRMPLKLSAKAKASYWQGGDKHSVSEEIGRLVCNPNRSMVPEENTPFGIRLKVECKQHIDYYQARLKDVKAAIRKVKKEHNGETFVAILKNTRGSYSWGQVSSLDFAFLDTDERPDDDYRINNFVAHIYTYADLITHLTAIADHLASVDAESEEKRMAIENAHDYMRSRNRMRTGRTRSTSRGTWSNRSTPPEPIGRRC